MTTTERNSKGRFQPKDAALLKEIRSNLGWCQEHWGPIHKEGNQDVLFVAGDPWDPQDINARSTPEQMRPHMVFDEGSQYVNQFVGQWRQQQRSVKVEPMDEQANAETATMLQARVYHIEYASRAQAHYVKAVKDVTTRGYGFVKIGKKYSGIKGREQEPCVVPVPNPDSVLMDPNAKEPDSSDAQFYFVFDKCSKVDVKRRHPKAKTFDFDKGSNTIILAEYYRLEPKKADKRMYLKGADGSESERNRSEFPEDWKPEEDGYSVEDERDISEKMLVCYTCQITEMSNPADSDGVDGVEILGRMEWPELDCPNVVSFYGEQFWVGNPGAQKLTILSMLRRARDPMQALNYTRTTQAELAAMIPKTRFIMYEGQDEGYEAEWANIGTSPLSKLTVKATTDGAQNQVLPHPTIVRWEPPIQNLEVYAQSLQNAVRSAVGQLASPELDKSKSGIAIDKIKAGGESAVYHITQNAEFSLQQVGRVYVKLIMGTHDSRRTVPVRMPNGDSKLIRINEPHDDPETKKRVHYDFTRGDYGCTISTGPSHQSQFDAAKDFISTVVTAKPELFDMFGDMFIKMQNLGPSGDAMEERSKKMIELKFPGLIESKGNTDPEAEAAIQKAQQFIDLQTKHINELQKAIDTEQVKAAKEIKIQEMKDATAIRVAEIGQVAKVAIPQIQAELDAAAQHTDIVSDAMHKVSDQQHEIGLKQMDQQHAADMQNQSLSVQQQEAESARNAAAEAEPATA